MVDILQSVMEMFRERSKPVTAYRERIVQALEDGDQTPEIVSIRDAIASHYKKHQESNGAIVLLPPDNDTTSPPTTTVTSLSNSKISLVTTRRNKK